MSRWIDVDALIKRLEDVSYGMKLPRAVVGLTKALLEDFPSIDLVRCGECKHWTKWSLTGEYFCGCLEGGIGGSPDDFCSYGERKESE